MQQDSSNITDQLDDTTSALKSGLTSIPLDVAAGVVSKWQSTLGSSGNPALESIASDLGLLGKQLSGGSLNAQTVGQLLTGLSDKVAAAASTQSGVVMSGLTQLSSALSSAGSQLLS